MIRPEAYELMREAWRESIPREYRFTGWDRLEQRGEMATNFQATEAARQERMKARQAADNAKRQRAKSGATTKQQRLCPACGAPVEGRGKTCSMRCRSTMFRERQRQAVNA